MLLQGCRVACDEYITGLFLEKLHGWLRNQPLTNAIKCSNCTTYNVQGDVCCCCLWLKLKVFVRKKLACKMKPEISLLHRVSFFYKLQMEWQWCKTYHRALYKTRAHMKINFRRIFLKYLSSEQFLRILVLLEGSRIIWFFPLLQPNQLGPS